MPGDDHPVAWVRAIDAGRSFYTARPHRRELSEPLFLRHIEEAPRWAGRQEN